MPQPVNNPFTPDEPITTEERFYGREDAIEWIDDRFVEGQCLVAVYGTPRIGKTSLLFRLRPRLAGRCIPIYVDLGSFPQAPTRDLLWRLLTQVHQELTQEHEGIPALSEEQFLAQPDYLHEVVLPLWRPLLHGKHVALLLDGLDLGQVREGSWAEFLLRLQEILAREKDLYAVITVNGAPEQDESVPALRKVPKWDLDYLTEGQTEDLLVGTARYQLGFDYDALRRIYALTGGHPYLVQVYGAELYRRLAPFGQVTIHMVNDLTPVVLSIASQLFADAWEGLLRQDKVALSAVGAMHGYRGAITPWDVVLFLRRAGYSVTTEAMEQALRELCRQHIMHWYGGTAHTLRMELWSVWLADTHPLTEVLHGKRSQRPDDGMIRQPRLAVEWGTLLLWVGLGLAVILVVRVWTARNSHRPAMTPQPTLTAIWATDEPTPTRVPLPGLIAYMAQSTPNDPWGIWVMHDDGTDPVCLSDGSGEDTMPAWSPDGKQIAFISNRSGHRNVWVMNADGSQPVNITRSAADDWTPCWSPDGSQLAFASNRDGNWEIYTCKRDGSALLRLTTNKAADYAPSWSPDGKRIAFVSERDGNEEIYVINADGSGLTRLTDNKVTDFAPHWSPDGQQIAFETYRDGNMEIYVMNADGSNQHDISNDPKSDEHWPCWSPDGKRITYYSNKSGNWDIWAMLADGSQQVNLTASQGIEQAPAWQPKAP